MEYHEPLPRMLLALITHEFKRRMDDQTPHVEWLIACISPDAYGELLAMSIRSIFDLLMEGTDGDMKAIGSIIHNSIEAVDPDGLEFARIMCTEFPDGP